MKLAIFSFLSTFLSYVCSAQNLEPMRIPWVGEGVFVAVEVTRDVLRRTCV